MILSEWRYKKELKRARVLRPRTLNKAGIPATKVAGTKKATRSLSDGVAHRINLSKL